jgi:hypothetical protein
MKKTTRTNRPRKTHTANSASNEARVREFGRAWGHCAEPRELKRFVKIVQESGSVESYIRDCSEFGLGLVERLYFDLNGPDGDIAVLFGKPHAFWCRFFGSDTPLIDDAKLATAFVEEVLRVWQECQTQR